ncbi:MAG: hypothetical protein JWM59_2531 [Verrucomicrobiales bacterium]|nr:hypothetical protein [Verrucomicrobiales bacterium]
MRIRILSDLHREFGPTPIPSLEADVIIMPGDVATKLNGLPWIHEFRRDTPVAYVCGNHEFYGDRLPRVREKLQAATAGTGVHVLEDDWFTMGGWHIYGCTLWTDFALLKEWSEGASLAGEIMNDYKRIRNSSRHYRKLSPADTRLLHLQSVRKLDEFLGSHDPSRTIVVTHHAPSLLSLPDRRRNQSISCAYASNLDGLVLKHQPVLWVHGHIHHSNDYFIGRTRVVANPQGYPDEPNLDFNPSLLIDLPLS